MEAKKKKQLLFLLVYVLLACSLIFFLEPVYFYTVLIVLVPPTVLNFLWLKRSRIKVAVFAFVAVILFAPPVEIAARLANVWEVQTVFPEFLGLVSVENMLFAFINFFWVLTFYEYFVDRDTDGKISKRYKYLVGSFCIFSVFFFVLYFYNQQLVTLNYFQIAFFTLIIPSLIIFTKKPQLIKKTVLTTVFFALVFFVYELVAIKIGNWWWPGEYWLTFNVWGEVFPVDDIIIWYFLSTPTLIGGYEFFADDWR